ncbi:inositol monophosphatase family protein [Streptomyces sp. NPDC048277]|uniref:inositol monophosphatase family protein n=1 Tax=Streptomyces sp. NPDC048277 TaxID=3155027 RepID=UPI0033EBCBA9
MTEYADLLPAVVKAANRGAEFLMGGFDPGARPLDRNAIRAVAVHIEGGSRAAVREALDGLLPSAGWLDEDENGNDVPPGEWWIVDGAEGGVNYVYGLPEWAVTITLVRDGVPQLTVVRQPIGDLTYTAVKGAGAHLNGDPLRVSAKNDLRVAMVTASQAGNSPAVHARFGRAITTMLDNTLLVRNTIPTTFPILTVASGQHDVFFQYDPDLPGTAAGVLLATEAGGVATEISGAPWVPQSPDVLIAAPGLHAAAAKLLDSVQQP